VALALIAAYLVGYALVVTITATPRPEARVWFAPFIWTLAAVGLLLLYRGWRASYRGADPPAAIDDDGRGK
jgi:hypothetical protein